MHFKSVISAVVAGLILLGSQVVSPALAQEATNPEPLKLPDAVSQAVLQDLSQKLGVEASALRIDQFNFAAPGWIVVPTDGNHRYVYHTNDSGSSIQMEPKSN